MDFYVLPLTGSVLNYPTDPRYEWVYDNTNIYFNKNKPLYICFIPYYSTLDRFNTPYNGRNLIYKLSLYENIRSQIVEGEAGNSLNMKVTFLNYISNDYSKVSPYFPYYKSTSGFKNSFLQVNSGTKSVFRNLHEPSTRSSWSFYLLPEMRYVRNPGNTNPGDSDFQSTVPLIKITSQQYSDDDMYDIDNYYWTATDYKLFWMRLDAGDGYTNVENMLIAYYELFIRHFDNITMPMIMGLYLNIVWNGTGNFWFYLENMRVYRYDSSVGIDGPIDPPDYYKFDAVINSIYLALGIEIYTYEGQTITKYEDMTEEIYPSLVKAYDSDTGTGEISLEILITDTNNVRFFTDTTFFHGL